jgi:hypothetical protein
MTQQSFTVLPGLAGPRPTLPPGGRMDDVSRRSAVLRTGYAFLRLSLAHALPGSGAALCCAAPRGVGTTRDKSEACAPRRTVGVRGQPLTLPGIFLARRKQGVCDG